MKKARAPAQENRSRLKPILIPHTPADALTALMEADPEKVKERLRNIGVKKKLN